MRNRTYAKDIRRSVTHSWSRFWAIFAIVALGAGFFAGLRSTAPDMEATGDAYYDAHNVMDAELISSLGFSQGDVDAIQQTQGVDSVMAVHRADVISLVNGEEQVLRIHGLPADLSESNSAYMNRPVLTSGRMPQNPGECIVGASKMDSDTLELGSVIVLEDEDGTLKDTVKYSRYTVVGFVSSAYYISFTLGSTQIGNGTLSYYMFVPDTDFTQDAYTDIFVTVGGAKALSTFSDAYADTVGTAAGALETLADSREVIRYNEITGEAEEELADAQREYDTARADAEKELADAEKELRDGETEIADGEQKLRDAEAEIADGEQQLADAKHAIASNKRKLNAAEQEYQEGVTALAAGQSAYAEAAAGLAAQQQQWQDAYAAVMQGYADCDAAEAAAGGDPVILAAIAAQRAQLQAAQTQLDAQKPQLDAAQAELDASKAQLDKTALQLAAARQTIDSGWAKLSAAKRKVKNGEADLAQARLDYETGKADLEEAKTELADGWAEYREAKADADRELADAQAEIDDGYQKLSELEPPEWYVLDRNDNVGYDSFAADAGRMDSLSSVFPVIFFLVAALVALTTMTRMVDEERLIIGTYKALGYSNGRIAAKYISYALLASLAGGAAGVAIGLFTLPVVCWNAYRLMYTAPDLITQINIEYSLTGVLAATACTLIATVSACRSTLAEQPAALMLPRAPKAGKRIFLESVPFIWKRLSFTRKVTFRNLFRYKKRLIMTIVGIAGCTALLLTGFGLKDSIANIIHNQYGQIYRYNTMIGLSDNEISDDTQAVLDSSFSNYTRIGLQAADVYSADGGTFQPAYKYVPQDPAALKSFIALRERVSGNDVPFGAGSVVLTEKLAKILNVSAGGDVSLKNADGELVSFTVTGVTENYVFHYIYIDPALFASRMGEAAQMNTVIAACTETSDDGRKNVSNRLLKSDGVSTVSFTVDIGKKFDDMITSLNYIVLVLILCAGALAFVVLYNLTNINVTERKRELATIKVLGFYDREVASYIYRETTILMLIGCVLGLGFGVLMHAFVIQTVEVDSVMFGRDIAPVSFVWSAALTVLFTLIVDIVMFKKLKNISMTDNLKSVD